LRFWESRFFQLQPQKRRGRRYYRPEDVVLLKQVKYLLYEQGYTIKGAQQFLEEKNMKPDDKQIDLFIPSTEKLPVNAHKSVDVSKQVENLPVKKLKEVLDSLHCARDSLARVIAGE